MQMTMDILNNMITWLEKCRDECTVNGGERDETWHVVDSIVQDAKEAYYVGRLPWEKPNVT